MKRKNTKRSGTKQGKTSTGNKVRHSQKPKQNQNQQLEIQEINNQHQEKVKPQDQAIESENHHSKLNIGKYLNISRPSS